MARYYAASGDEAGEGVEVLEAASGGGDASPYAALDVEAIRNAVAKSLLAQSGYGSSGSGGGSGGYGGGGSGGGGASANAWGSLGTPGAGGWSAETLASWQAANEAADPYGVGQYFQLKPQASGSVTDVGWMNALQPWQGGVTSGGQPGTATNNQFVGGGSMTTASPSYWSNYFGTGQGGLNDNDWKIFSDAVGKEAAEEWVKNGGFSGGIDGGIGGIGGDAGGVGGGGGGGGGGGVGPGQGPGAGGPAGGGSLGGGGIGSDAVAAVAAAAAAAALGYAGSPSHFGDVFGSPTMGLGQKGDPGGETNNDGFGYGGDAGGAW